MIRAIRAIRAHGLKTAALTNNWPGAADTNGDAGTAGGFGGLRDDTDPLFDIVVESAVEGLRKPDPRIYELVVRPARRSSRPRRCSSTTSAST